MKLVTQRDMIKGVYKRWLQQYPKDSEHVSPEHKKIGEALSKLNLKKVTAKEIDDLIGNQTWTTANCDECDNRTENYIQLGDTTTLYICLDCAKAMAKILSA